MNYKETLDFLFSNLPMFQRVGGIAYKNNLDTTLALDEYFGHSHEKFRSVHIAGTNGKGSVAHMLASVLQMEGYRTGLYTSPHMKDFRERIKVNGEYIHKEKVVLFVQKNRKIIEELKPSFFEMTVAMAFDYFAEQEVDIAVVEAGMGGRLDSTNIIEPVVSVITNIGLDHTQFLGDTYEKIAIEKAGIIKPGIPVVIGETAEATAPLFIEKAAKNGSLLFFADQELLIGYSMRTLDDRQVFNIYHRDDIAYESLETDLLGLYQRKNVVTALKTLELLNQYHFPVSKESVYQGLSDVKKHTGIRGRWEVIGNNPLIVCDTGHNEDGIRIVVQQLMDTPHRNLHVIFGMVKDKDPIAILRHFPREVIYYFTQANIPRAMERDTLAALASQAGLSGMSYPDPPAALEAAKKNATPEDVIFIGGSTFIVAEVL